MTGQARRDSWRQRLAERPARMAVGLWMVFLLAWMNKAQAQFRQRKRASLAAHDAGTGVE